MKEQLQERLKELKFEFESGKKKLAEIDTQGSNLRNTLLRISGAVQVLEEELAKESAEVGETSSAKTHEVAEDLVTAGTTKIVNMSLQTQR